MSWRGREPFGQLAAVRLGAAGDVGAVSLDDERELHRCGSAPRRRGASGAVQLAAQARGLERQLLHAGEQHLVDAALPLEVVAAVLEEPAKHRHQDAALDEDDAATPAPVRAVRLVAHRRRRAARCRARRAARGGCSVAVSGVLRGRVQQRFDVGKERRDRRRRGRAAAATRSCARSRSRTRPCSSAMTASTGTLRRHRPKPSPTPDPHLDVGR